VRIQDELINLYPRLNRFDRKFVLTELGRLSRVFDAEDVLDSLQDELTSSDPLLRDQAECSLVHFLPGYIRCKYGVDGTTRGLWSRYRDSTAGMNASLGTRAVESRAIEQNAFLSLRPLARHVLQLTSSGRLPGQAARRALAQVPLLSIQDHLRVELRKPGSDLGLLLAYARAGGQDVLDAVQASHEENPSLLLGLSTVPSHEAIPAIAELAPRTRRMGRAHLAIALGFHVDVDPDPAVESLLSRRESWVQVYVLWALRGNTWPGGLSRIVSIRRGAVSTVRSR